jgi:hypothetical protein
LVGKLIPCSWVPTLAVKAEEWGEVATAEEVVDRQQAWDTLIPISLVVCKVKVGWVAAAMAVVVEEEAAVAEMIKIEIERGTEQTTITTEETKKRDNEKCTDYEFHSKYAIDALHKQIPQKFISTSRRAASRIVRRCPIPSDKLWKFVKRCFREKAGSVEKKMQLAAM